MSSSAGTPPVHRAVRPGLVLAGVLALAVNLRAGLAGYPPLLETARADLGIGAGGAGLVQAGAVLMMSAGSFGAAAVAARVGRERLLGVAVATIGLGSLLRAVAALPALIGGSVLVGLGIGVAGVLLTGVVKEHLAERAGAVTGAYVVSMMIGATIASAVAVPLAVALGGWSFSLAVWAVPAVLAVAVWIPVASRMGRAAPVAAGNTVGDDAGDTTVRDELRTWRDPFARRIACYLAGSSTIFYGWLTWLSPFYEQQGWSPQAAGLLLAVWSIAQIPAALLFPAAAERQRRWQLWASLTVLSSLAGTLGALFLPAPGTPLPWLWASLIGIGVGAGFPLGLTVIAWRTPTPARSAAVSGFGLGIGYFAAGIGPLVMGLLIDLGGFPPAIVLLVAAAGLQAAAVWRIGDRRE
ncbi:cyanate transporter [Pseudonocardia sp. EC080610-09]|uniref:MFS transporter n=1 Tax=unclassified Pseudonocardia TaxID=2619320 RepID=UPI0007067DBD|nr:MULTISPECIES: MFS transporter [unclassified Pseudonocardia]ALL74295.1 cyanate transporter [Pseudonocardia sp. EC080610-09]ALL81318.1 cyanate transporter [Pseudonocardia sp. EC080619-01]